MLQKLQLRIFGQGERAWRPWDAWGEGPVQAAKART